MLVLLQAATQEALSCLQDQLVELENRVATIEEFGTAFNAAAVAAAVGHRQQQQQHGEGDMSRYASCVASSTDGEVDTLPSSPFAAHSAAAGAAATMTAAGSSASKPHHQHYKGAR